jgi:ABC-type microcin C transport system duplicated ATPase subunit YejF
MAAASDEADDPRETIFALDRLDVRFDTKDGEVHAVRSASLEVKAGETVAIVGESGSGKSQAMMAAMGLLADNGRATGSVRYRGEEILGLPARTLNRIRGTRISMIFQEPMTSLDPLYSIGKQISEPIIRHRGGTWRSVRPEVIELLRIVGIGEAERRIDSYPHELSGGQRQRAMIAMALANGPDLLIADEPTTALDVTIQAQILALLADLRERLGMAIVFITHDLNIVRRFAERIYVMRRGEVVEGGATGKIFAAPEHPHTKMLLAAEPEGVKGLPPPDAPSLLDAHGVRVHFHLGAGFFGGGGFTIRAVDGIDLSLRRGQTVGIVGESGSGKSTLSRALLRLVPVDGRIRFEGKDLAHVEGEALRALRRHLQIVFQDPYGSLSPRLTVGQIVTEGLLVHEPGLSAGERDRRAVTALEEVQLDPATRNRYPHEFSGGQRQRIAIARAIILKPRVVILDEPTSALDRSVQKRIVELLRGLQDEHGLSYIFISHDLAVVRAMADTILVMRNGRVVEAGPAEAIFARPQEDYTRELMAAAFGTQSPAVA